MAGYAVAHFEQIDEIDDGREPFRPVRHHFGITSFGFNVWTGREAGARIINEHDEEGEAEELYVVQSGRARFEIDGESVDAPEGTLIFVQPGVMRTAFAEEPGTTLLAVGGTPGEAYRPDGWELWAPINPLYTQGRYAEAADRALALVEANPQYPGLNFNLACCESLAGRHEDAIAHLRAAIAADDRCREWAAKDSDFDPIRDEPAFAALIAG